MGGEEAGGVGGCAISLTLSLFPYCVFRSRAVT